MANHISPPPGSKDIAWNGIQFSYPGNWQIAAIGQSYLMMEGPGGPTVEVIWSRIKGKFDQKSHLKRLAAHFPRKMPARITAWPLPSEWQDAVSGFDVSGFQWRSPTEHGRGALLYCAACQRASLVHFFRLDPAGGDGSALKMLKSFGDHYNEGGQVFSVFDMRATLPVPFELDQYRLEAGRFELVFVHRRNRIVLHRWALAAIALKGKGLAEFGREVNLVDPRAAQAMTVGSFGGIEEQRDAAGADAWLRWLTARPCHYWCRLWHVTPCNRILGVVAETRRPMNTALFDRICQHYETY